jgi:uncharacterized protein (DUF302 family)
MDRLRSDAWRVSTFLAALGKARRRVRGFITAFGVTVAAPLTLQYASPPLRHSTLPPVETTVSTDNGVVTVASRHSVDETVRSLEEQLRAKGIKLFALIDHSGEAKAAGFEMRPTKLLIFGNPKAGTPLMIAAPSIAIDLPLKLLVWEDAGGKVWISYNTSAYLQKRHDLPPELTAPLAGVEALARNAAE